METPFRREEPMALAALEYRQEGDYRIPDLKLTDTTERPIGKYGRMRKEYLKNHRKGLYSALLLSGKLMEHLADTEGAASQRMETLMRQLLEKNPISEELKNTNPLEWVGRMENLKARAEEIVLTETVYAG
jgi:hypothetical protein